VEVLDDPVEGTIDSYVIPLFGKVPSPFFDIPTCTDTLLLTVLDKHKDLFNTTPGHTELAEHFIPTTGTPVKVLPHKIPANY